MYLHASSNDDLIRPMTAKDLELVLSWRNHPNIRRYMFSQHEIALVDHVTWFERAAADERKHLLIYEESGRPLGFVNFTETHEGHIAEWSFHAAPDAPKGIGTNLGRAALKYAFNTLSFHKVCGQVITYNERSIRLHARLGFINEGLLRDQFYDGRNYYSVVCFGILDCEWKVSTQTKPSGGIN